MHLKEPRIKLIEEKTAQPRAETEVNSTLKTEESINSSQKPKLNKSLSIITRSVSDQIEFFRKQKSIYNLRGSIRPDEKEKDRYRSLRLIPKPVEIDEFKEKSPPKLNKATTFIDIESRILSPIKDKHLMRGNSEIKKKTKKMKNKLENLLTMEPLIPMNQKFVLPKLNLKSTSILEGILNHIV